MNELAELVPGDIDFPIMDAIFGVRPCPPYMEIIFVLFPLLFSAIAIWLHNKSVGESQDLKNVFAQSLARVLLDIALVVGICGIALGVVAMTISFDVSSDVRG